MTADATDPLEEGRRLASQREDLIAAGVDPSELLVPLAPIGPRAQGRGWWVISGDALHAALCRVAAGESPDMAYAELYANSDIESVEGDE